MNAASRPRAEASARNSIPTPSIRAQFTERRTYLRPLDEDSIRFETPAQMLDRVISHQRWLWENQVGRSLNRSEEDELSELRSLMEQRKVSVSGRVKWMGGTQLVKERASGAFNCSFTHVETPADMVDVAWLLLQGCGVGFKPIKGLLTGLPRTIKNVVVVPSTRTDKGGAEDNTETVENGFWTITVGDSAKAWARAIGKLFASKPRVHSLVLDLSELRPGGKRLKGYGWLSSGWEPLAKALKAIAEILINAGERPLTAIEIGDVINWIGTILSSRRSAEMWTMDDFDNEIEDFIDVKVDRWAKGQGQREQSNNTILFWTKPSRERVVDLLHRILDEGDPGFANAAHAKRRAPEFDGFNPCAEILLPSKGFCNLMQVVWSRFNGDLDGLYRAMYLAARANYRQTCVSMRDGILQLEWNDNQSLLRLCGVSPTGFVAWEYAKDPEMLENMRRVAIEGANSMADEFGTPRARRVTQVQPAGTVSKVLGLEGDEVQEGAHISPSRFIFNHVNFSKYDNIVDVLRKANYRVRENPNDSTGVLVTFPVAYPDGPYYSKVEREINGRIEEVELVNETAIDQLERYRLLMNHYVDHNCSITISYDEHEIEDMADWFMEHWDEYVGVSFLKRNDPTRTAEELGFKYLPQEAVSGRMYEEYMATLLPVDMSADDGHDLLDMQDCASGACPVR